MKTKGELKSVICIVAVLLLSIGIVVGTVWLHRHSYFDSVNAIMTFSIGIVSLLVSIVALVVALSTYFSIDAVNIISSMEGNVLCNENYNAEYPLLVERYSDCQNQQQLEEKMFQELYDKLRKSETCMQFTDCIQDILDHILWYAYVDTKTETYQRHVEKLIGLLEKKYNGFSAISNGNQYMLKEHIKLIMNVLNYQSIAHEGSQIRPNGEMLNIRGRMFLNAVSQTIYYDYLGLEYHKKALNYLRSVVSFSGEEFLQDNMKKIEEYKFSEDEKKELNIYLTLAADAFERAMNSSEEDILWKGYISFNKARIDLLRNIISSRWEKDWDASIKEAIDARYMIMKIFVPEEAEEFSFLHLEFQKEYYYAEALYLALKVYRGNRTKDVKKNAMLIKKSISTVSENEWIFKRTKLYLEDTISSCT